MAGLPDLPDDRDPDAVPKAIATLRILVGRFLESWMECPGPGKEEEIRRFGRSLTKWVIHEMITPGTEAEVLKEVLLPLTTYLHALVRRMRPSADDDAHHRWVGRVIGQLMMPFLCEGLFPGDPRPALRVADPLPFKNPTPASDPGGQGRA